MSVFMMRLVALLVIGAVLLAPALGGEADSTPVRIRDVRRMLHQEIDHDEIVRVIEQRGVGFRYTDRAVEVLLGLGFTQGHVEQIQARVVAPEEDGVGDAASRDAGPGSIAQRYPMDRRIGRDRHVIAFFGFQGEEWREALRIGNNRNLFAIAEDRQDAGFAPAQGPALAIRVAEDSHNGGSFSYFFGRHHGGEEPEAIYFRYYLRFGNDWDGRGGKLPGFGGTYNRAGWGGKPSNGTNGWSARGWFGSPRNGRIPIGTYCYHANMTGTYGDTWRWDCEPLERNRWYCVEQHLQLNTPGEGNGIIRAWVNGEQVFERENICFRNTDELKIERIWGNVYHGGKSPAASNDTMFIDNLVIATQYIGPVHVPDE